MQSQVFCIKVGKQFKCQVDQCDRSFTSWQGWQYHYLNKHTNIRNPSTAEEEGSDDVPSPSSIEQRSNSPNSFFGDASNSSKESTPERDSDTVPRKRPSSSSYLQERSPKNYKNSRRSTHVSCDVCGKKLSSSSNLKVHKNTLHFGQRWRCKICGRTCTSKESVIKTCKKMHEGEDVEFLRPEVNQEVSSPLSGIDMQLGDETDELETLDCIQSIVSLSSMKSAVVVQQPLTEHVSDTESEVEYSADSNESDHWCEEEDGQADFGRKPVCHICGKRFASNSSLKVHKNILHYGKRWRCKICGRVCTKKQNVQATCKRHHLGEDIEVISVTEADYVSEDTMDFIMEEPILIAESSTPWAKSNGQMEFPKA